MSASFRTRALLGGIFSLALVTAPLSLALTTAPASATAGHAFTPFLAQNPRTFPPAQVTFTVNTTSDSNDNNPGDGVCSDGTNCSLRAAIEEANALGKTADINVPPGTYTLTVGGPPPAALSVTDSAGVQIAGTGPGVTITNAGAANDIIETDRNAAGAGGFLGASLANTTISGGAGGGLAVKDPNDTLTAAGVTFFGNSFVGNGGAVSNDGQAWISGSTFLSNSVTGGNTGGAIYNSNGSMRLTGDTFTGNTSDSDGGAIYNTNGPVAIDNSTFTSNSVSATATNHGGGAFYDSDEAELTNDTFTGNSATTTTGNGNGGRCTTAYGLNSVVNSTFTGNQATSASAANGGGGAFYDSNAVTITGSTFQGNVANTGNGGAIFEESNGLLLSGSVVSGNSTTGGTGTTNAGLGGGVWAYDIANISSTTISGNSATWGGGLASDDGVIVNNSLISGNQANLGGGTWSEGNYGVQMSSVAIVDNSTGGSADAGGGVYVSGTGASHIDFHTVTVAGNVSDSGGGIAVSVGGGRWLPRQLDRWSQHGARRDRTGLRLRRRTAHPARVRRWQRGRRLDLRLHHELGPSGSRGPGLLDDRLRRRRLQLQRRLLRLHGRQAAQQADRRHGSHPGQPGLLGGRLRRRRLQLR